MKEFDIKAIVFDLDGTLYEDTHHFAYYAERVKNKLPHPLRASFEKDYSLVLNNKHPLKFGRIYDLERQLIIVQINDAVTEAYSWDGSQLAIDIVRYLYPSTVTIDNKLHISIGDMWWIANSIGRHYGLSRDDTHEAFLETREYMMSSDFTMKPVAGLKEVLHKLSRRIPLVLLTNSPQPDSEVILEKLGIREAFQNKIFQARKPSRTEEHFTGLAQLYNINYSKILSVGDNWVNDIAKPKELGCHTIFIDPHEIGSTGSADVIVRRTSEIVPYLEQLI